MARPVCSDCQSALSRRERAEGICGSCGADVRPPESPPTVTSLGQPLRPQPIDESPEIPTRESMLGLAKKQAALSLFVIAALLLVCGGLSVFIVAERQGNNVTETALAAAVVGAISLVFVGLGCWALRMPIPPAVIGLVLFIGISGLDLLAEPASAARGMFLRIFVAAMLFRAISNAVRAGRLAPSDGVVQEYDD